MSSGHKPQQSLLSSNAWAVVRCLRKPTGSAGLCSWEFPLATLALSTLAVYFRRFSHSLLLEITRLLPLSIVLSSLSILILLVCFLSLAVLEIACY